MKKIVFISCHDYIAKRQGGFHVFAEKLSKDFEVVFFSYPRSFFIKIRPDREIEYDNIHYFKDRDETFGNVRNVSTMFYIPPVSLLKFFPDKLNEFFFRLRIPTFKKFCDKYFGKVDYFMFESAAGVVVLFDYLKEKYPDAKFLYRPSDPMFKSPDLSFYYKYERNLIEKCDFIFAVNQEGIDLYRDNVPGWDDSKCEIISNGIELSAYEKEYPMPDVYKGCKNIVSYIGARPAEWDMLVEASAKLPEVNFFVICPAAPNKAFKDALEKNQNLHYIQGISPKQVPQYVSNSDVIMIPNPTGMYKTFPWGITAKFYQAMKAHKPIVVYEDEDEISNLGIAITHDYNSFISEINKAVHSKKEINYNFDFEKKDWNVLAKRMKEIIETL